MSPPGGQAGSDVYYYVRGAFIEDFEEYETASTDTVVVNVPGDDIDKQAVNSAITNNTFFLFQNFPNPFNPTTTISYSLPVSDHVTIKVFDILGKEVATLLNEQKEVGIYSIEFDASNLSVGVYFYNIQTGNYTETRKLVLQK